jgi:two-component system chemotaxis sensor kinase CheA
VLREIGLFSGATVLGSGSLAMILDIAAAGERAGVRAVLERSEVAVVPVPAAPASSSFLIFEDCWAGDRLERMALPLSVVVRIESVPFKDVEYAGGRPLLQYRGELLPLEDRGGVLRETGSGPGSGMATVLICQRPDSLEAAGGSAGQRMGMVVRRVVEVAGGDLVDFNAELCTDRLAMVNDRLTVVQEAFGGPWQRSESLNLRPDLRPDLHPFRSLA